MNPARIADMAVNAIAFDLETHLIQPGLRTPPIVLGSAAEVEQGEISGKLLSKDEARWLFRHLLRNPKYTIVVANGPYDFNVMAVDAAQQGEDLLPEIFNLYDPQGTIVRGFCDGRVWDVQRVEALHAIAQGHLKKDQWSLKPFPNNSSYSLDQTTYQVLGRENAKVNDKYRLSYAMFDGVPLEDLPFEARTYPIDDATNTEENGLAQAGHLPAAWVHQWSERLRDNTIETVCNQCGVVMTADTPQACMILRPRRNLHEVARQTYADYALQLSALWGFEIDQDAVDALERKINESRKENIGPFIQAGIIREKDGTVNESVLKKLVAVAYSARNACSACAGTGKVPSPKTEGRTKINCAACDGCGLDLPPTVPRSDKGGISKDRDTLHNSADPLLMKFGEFGADKKLTSTYIPLLRSARICNACGRTEDDEAPIGQLCAHNQGWRDIPLLPSPESLVETGRCAYKKGLHGLPRKGGIRECFRARNGMVYSSEDYQAGELVTLAEVCFDLVGFSDLGDALNKDLDAHLALAGTMSGNSYERMLELKAAGDPLTSYYRQGAKAGNFGFGGGMAELTFTLRKRADPDLFTPCEGGPDERDGKRGFDGLRTCILLGGETWCGKALTFSYKDEPCTPVCVACLEQSKKLREFWFQQWREMRPFFAEVKKMLANPGPSGTPEIVHHFSKRIRGGVGFCDGANGLFQGLLSDAAKDAYCQVVRECYDRTWRVRSSEMMQSKYEGQQSPLWGSRALMLAHDEVIAEHPESVAHYAADRVSEIMVESLRFKCPRLFKAVKAEPTLMRRLYKGAEPRYLRGGKKPADANDILIPWEPSQKKAA